MSLPADIGGLRRRSPNPNSPDLEDARSPSFRPFSAFIPSPDLCDDTQGLSASFSPNPARSPASVYTPWQGATPTIRLVPSSSQGGSDQPPTPIPLDSRSRSDDHDAHPHDHTASSPAASLHRHVTDPNYSYLRRSGVDHDQPQPFIITRDRRDKPFPPVPLIPRRTGSVDGSLVESEDLAKSEVDSVEVASAGTGRRTWSSLLVNPFKTLPIGRERSTTSRPTRWRPHNLLSRPMRQSPTVAPSGPFSVRSVDTNPYRSYLVDRDRDHDRPLSISAGLKDKMKKRFVGTGGDKLTAKFPERTEAEDTEWTSFKIVLLLSVLSLFGYGLASLCWSLQIMLRISQHSDVTMVSDPDVVIFLLFFSLLCIFTSFVGLTGTLLSSRPILAFYNLLLWPTFISLALVGYTSFKRSNLHLDRKLNQVWSQFLSDEDRLRIQTSLGCCGYYNPYHDATYSKKCYPRTSLAGCKAEWTLFEERALHDFATAAFSTVPLHILSIIVALICSNHVDRQFGKGITPLKYRLQAADVRANAIAILKDQSSDTASHSSLRRSAAMRESRSQASSARVTLAHHQRQQSFDSFHKRREHKSTVESAPAREMQGGLYNVRRRGTDDFDLPRPPHSRLSSLTFGRRTSGHSRNSSHPVPNSVDRFSRPGRQDSVPPHTHVSY